MPKHAFAPTNGRFQRWVIDSSLLENRLGDPTEREILTHISPEGIEMMEQGKALPVLIYLAPFTSSGPARAGWKAFGETLPQQVHATHQRGHRRVVSVFSLRFFKHVSNHIDD